MEWYERTTFGNLLRFVNVRFLFSWFALLDPHMFVWLLAAATCGARAARVIGSEG